MFYDSNHHHAQNVVKYTWMNTETKLTEIREVQEYADGNCRSETHKNDRSMENKRKDIWQAQIGDMEQKCSSWLNWLGSGVKVSWRAPSEKLILQLGSSEMFFFFRGSLHAHFCPQKVLLLGRPKAQSEKKKKRIPNRRRLYKLITLENLHS